MRRCVLAFAAFVAVATEAAAATSFGAVHRSITGARRASAGRAGPLLSDLSHSTPDTNEELGTTAGSGFMYYGDSLKKPTRMSLRGGSPMDGGNGERLNIVFVSAEVAPWSVTGGLGAVCDGLPRALAAENHRVMSIAPRYDQYYDAWDTEFTCEVPLGEGTTTVRFFHAYKKGVDRVFVDHPLFLEKVWGLTKQKLYGPKWGKDWEDNQLRFAMFCRAAMAATERLTLGGSSYGQKVMFVANDWQAALVPVYLKQHQAEGQWLDARSATICHNMVYQGRFPSDGNAERRLGVRADMLEAMTIMQTLKVGKQKEQVKGTQQGKEIANPPMPVINFLLGALQNSNIVLTVSPGYAREVSTCPIKGAEMQKTLQRVGIQGILNGVEDVVRPDNAVLGLTETYDADSLDKKKLVKASMQASLGFAVDPSVPMFLFMGRLDGQKGVDILFEAIKEALQAGSNAQFVTMGSGIETMEEAATELEDRYPQNFRAVLSFKGAEKYRTFAAADFALMPSRYEPCGLVQMEGMRFGTLPIVCPTGGLADTVHHMQTGVVLKREVDQDGCVPEDVQMLKEAIAEATSLFRDEATYREMQKAAMKVAGTYSWRNSAVQYIERFRALWR